MQENFYAVIIAGGSGTRLWPKSRKKTPKHLLDLFGTGSLLRMTYERIAPLLSNDKIFVVTHHSHVEQIRTQLPEIPAENIIAEPVAKGTAMAMAVAAAFVHKKDPNAVIFNLWADQMFDNLTKFHKTFGIALKTAASGEYIVSVGIRPTFAHTGLGYIKIGKQFESEEISEKDFVFKGAGFKEKPNLSTAQAFYASGQYLWNTGLYCWSTQTLAKAFEMYSKHLFDAFTKIVNEQNPTNHEFMETVYEEVGSPDAIDYEVSEKAKNILIVPGEFGWSDVGDWKVVYDTEKKDSNNNVLINKDADNVTIDARDNLIDSNGKMIAVVGLSNIVVIETDDAILVCHKDKSQDVKKVVEKLKEEQKDRYL